MPSEDPDKYMDPEFAKHAGSSSMITASQENPRVSRSAQRERWLGAVTPTSTSRYADEPWSDSERMNGGRGPDGKQGAKGSGLVSTVGAGYNPMAQLETMKNITSGIRRAQGLDAEPAAGRRSFKEVRKKGLSRLSDTDMRNMRVSVNSAQDEGDISRAVLRGGLQAAGKYDTAMRNMTMDYGQRERVGSSWGRMRNKRAAAQDAITNEYLKSFLADSAAPAPKKALGRDVAPQIPYDVAAEVAQKEQRARQAEAASGIDDDTTILDDEY